MYIINEEDLVRLNDCRLLTDAMQEAMIKYSGGDFIMPERMHLDFDQNTLLLMPAVCGDYFATKLVSLYPDNPKSLLPVLQGAVMLNDRHTGTPLALLNGAKLTALRTAAVSAAGIRFLSPKGSTSMGLAGAGVQGLQQVLFTCAVRPITRVIIYDQIQERIDPFIACLRPLLPDVEFRSAATAGDMLKSSEIIILATNAKSPVLPDDAEMLKDKHVVAIGSYKPEMREIPDRLFTLHDRVVVDTELALEESGDLIDPIRMGILKPEQVVGLGHLMTSGDPGDFSGGSLFKTVGMALFDLFAARFFYQRVLEGGFKSTRL